MTIKLDNKQLHQAVEYACDHDNYANGDRNLTITYIDLIKNLAKYLRTNESLKITSDYHLGIGHLLNKQLNALFDYNFMIKENCIFYDPKDPLGNGDVAMSYLELDNLIYENDKQHFLIKPNEENPNKKIKKQQAKEEITELQNKIKNTKFLDDLSTFGINKMLEKYNKGKIFDSNKLKQKIMMFAEDYDFAKIKNIFKNINNPDADMFYLNNQNTEITDINKNKLIKILDEI